jgi:hypothetical protein
LSSLWWLGRRGEGRGAEGRRRSGGAAGVAGERLGGTGATGPAAAHARAARARGVVESRGLGGGGGSARRARRRGGGKGDLRGGENGVRRESCDYILARRQNLWRQARCHAVCHISPTRHRHVRARRHSGADMCYLGAIGYGAELRVQN